MTFLRKLPILLMAATLLLTVGTSCRRSKVYRIGVSQCSQDDWRSKMNEEIDREIMFHEDAEVEIRSAGDSNQKQIADIRYFADHGFDILIVSPNEAEALTPVISQVHAAGMPVIIFDRNIIGDTYTARIGVDDVGLGRSAAHYALHMLGSDHPTALEIYGRPGSTPARGRHDGFAAEFAAGGGTVLASVPANWNMEEAGPVADSLLRLYPQVDLIYAHNDRMAIGASEAARSLGRRGNIRVIGIDAAPDIGIRAVADTVIDATFLYPTDGHRLIRTALAILRGEPYSREQILPVSSAVDLTNADILLLQNEALKEETGKMKILKRRIDDYWARHDSQTALFYASLAIIVLLFGLVFLILRAYRQHKSHQRTLLEQNHMLEQERDKQRALNDRLQQATQSKLMFFTNVSHDLRTPLTLITEPLAQVAEAPNLTPQQHTLMRLANKNVQILRRLINQILDFRKYENDKRTLHLTEIHPGEAIAEWMEAFRQLTRKRGLELTLHAPADASAATAATMAMDVEKMERVFFNLLSNAVKYTPEGGSITVSWSLGADSFTLQVADTGRGIDERDLGNIFDRFFQVDRVHPNGSGIGLSLTKAMVELHGGTITVASTPGQGSAFTVTLPVTHVDTPHTAPLSAMTGSQVEAELDAVEPDPATLSDDKPAVLVIDDNRDIRTLLAQLLGESYCVLTAANGADGLAKAAKYVPDLVICDVMMPGMDGLECCRRLKEQVTTSHIPVLMLTACTMDEQRVQGYTSGADGYLSKPFSADVLLARCASLIDNRKRIRKLWAPKAEQEHGGTTKPAPDPENEFYARFLGIFHERMADSELNIDGIASLMGLERTQFYRKIKALTGYSPVELIRRLRLDYGREQLLTTTRTISEVAYAAGFTTPAYFTRCYRETFGETPTDTRQSSRQ